jgi:hypothetical protein
MILGWQAAAKAPNAGLNCCPVGLSGPAVSSAPNWSLRANAAGVVLWFDVPVIS